MDLSLFEQDQNLVHGDISIQDALTPPAVYGSYSIRLPNDHLVQEKLNKIRVLLLSCMDKRVARPLYEELLKKGYAENEILMISMGGGPLQHGEERITAVKSAFSTLNEKLPGLERVWAVAHTKGCGGLKHFCGGKLVTEVAKPELLSEAASKHIDAELYVTDLFLGTVKLLLPEKMLAKLELAIAEPIESSQSVKLFPYVGEKTLELEEIIR